MLSGDWIAGFSDGEAWFSIQIGPSKSSKLGFNVAPIFRIEVAKRDGSILQSIKEVLEVGVLREHRGAIRYEVTSLSSCLKIKDFFEHHLLYTRKKLAFKLWSKALELIASKAHLTANGLLNLAKLRDKMNVPEKRQHLGKQAYRDYHYFKARLKTNNYQLLL